MARGPDCNHEPITGFAIAELHTVSQRMERAALVDALDFELGAIRDLELDQTADFYGNAWYYLPVHVADLYA